MSEHCGYVVKIEHLRPHSNADKMQIATFFGNDTCVSIDSKIGDIGIYFPSDLQLSLDFCIENHMLRKLPDGTPDTGYLDCNKRNVTSIKLRGEKSDGVYLPISCLAYTNISLGTLKVGDKIDTVNGFLICQKYIPKTNQKSSIKEGNRTRKVKIPIAPLFCEHADTEQLAYNLNSFKEGDQIEITLKIHGTSGRTAYIPVLSEYKRSFWDKIFKREGTPVYDWGYVSGTRRTILEDGKTGYYGSNEFREQYNEFFKGKLYKGEEVFYEIVGYTTAGQPIMPSVSNKKTNDKDFIKLYGEMTEFSYGCAPNKLEEFKRNEDGEYYIEYTTLQSDIYVYRMTITNEDGDIIEYSPDFMRYRCEQMGCKYVPVLWKGYISEPDDWTKEEFNPGEYIKSIAEEYYDGPDPIGKTHVREGVVVRIVNKPKFCAFKHKNFYFKCIEGICKADAEAPDMEEAEDVADTEA